MAKATPFDASQYLDSPQTVLAYLTETFELGDPSAMVGAIHAAARACGIADVADKAGLSCEDLEKISAATEFGTIVTILQAMKLNLAAFPVSSEAD
ncbi:MAG: transcriptional regulator [Bradyrhizobium sp.]|jgi:probable addiction module antidote protein|uniref:DNA-binding protein n=1 Tax=Bradyrhizobium sp. TaxID=376 RepID=UPI003BB222B9